jgi:hypothetical protein
LGDCALTFLEQVLHIGIGTFLLAINHPFIFILPQLARVHDAIAVEEGVACAHAEQQTCIILGT